jgi:hypothetical protein
MNTNKHGWNFPGRTRHDTNGKKIGVRWQSAAATPLFDRGSSFQSGVALRFPPQPKILAMGCSFIRVHLCPSVVESLLNEN